MMTNSAEREATEVLHSLLAVERIQNKSAYTELHHTTDIVTDKQQQQQQSETSPQQTQQHLRNSTVSSQSEVAVKNVDKIKRKPSPTQKKLIAKKSRPPSPLEDIIIDPVGGVLTPEEGGIIQVLNRFNQKCECTHSCFADLNPDSVNRHRLNIAELTRDEHDMYLMGVTMASLGKPNETSRHKERQRQRASYVYQGRRVCLDAFLYLENVTHYHLKRIRNHVLTHGVAPRVHGNMGKRPHNTFSLDLYKGVENFLKQYLSNHTADLTKPFIIHGATRAHVYTAYKNCDHHPDDKIMGYSTFRHFMKRQFPHVKFSAANKLDHHKVNSPGAGGGLPSKDQSYHHLHPHQQQQSPIGLPQIKDRIFNAQTMHQQKHQQQTITTIGKKTNRNLNCIDFVTLHPSHETIHFQYEKSERANGTVDTTPLNYVDEDVDVDDDDEDEDDNDDEDEEDEEDDEDDEDDEEEQEDEDDSDDIKLDY